MCFVGGTAERFVDFHLRLHVAGVLFPWAKLFCAAARVSIPKSRSSCYCNVFSVSYILLSGAYGAFRDRTFLLSCIYFLSRLTIVVFLHRNLNIVTFGMAITSCPVGRNMRLAVIGFWRGVSCVIGLLDTITYH